MKVLLVGGGGREHALAWSILKSPLVTGLLVTHANPGFPSESVSIQGDPVASAVEWGVELAVVGPEAPIAEGLTDRLRAAGIAVFAPSQAAGQLEASKEFAKAFMDRHGIPTGKWSAHTDRDEANAAIGGPCVVKADGLAAGKGVVVADSATEARAAVSSMLDGAFGEAGHRVIIEERLSGPELSILAICDGSLAIPMLPCRDHKRRFTGDSGPNTGGMGAVCPPSDATAALVEEVRATVLQPVVDGMRAEGTPFVGVLYAGIMLTDSGPKVLEFNVRFGDPECQPLMMMMDEDIVPIMLAAAQGRLVDRPFQWKDGAACCVVMVSDGYPGPINKGKPIRGIPTPSSRAVVFYAGATSDGDTVVTSGGRVLGVTAVGPDLSAATRDAYSLVEKISFDGASWRTDIGQTRRP
ncbi:MAG: phosphoribosylamine--glycine ligase [Myxococcota bacterium]|nr:phosphoribosylamine--glycine ligase [Myxococcota bacterium]